MQVLNATAQVTIPINTSGNPAQYVGLFNQPFPLLVAHKGTQDINFATGGTQRMVIKGTAAVPTAGFVGIGNNISLTSPLWQLDVDDNTNLNINYSNPLNVGYGYRINGNKILNNPGIENILVGNGAGASWLPTGPTTYTGCVFVGENAGTSNQGMSNTFIGDQAGTNNTSGNWNTFIGSEAGESNTTGQFNTFVGHHAGLKNTTGDGNTYLGYHAVGSNPPSSANFNTVVGYLSGGNLSSGGNQNSFFGARAGNAVTTGLRNTSLGYFAGFNTSTGSRNIFIGFSSGVTNVSGSDNIIIGRNANVSTNNLNNAIAIGSQAVVTANDIMILGNNNVNVGIGLSGVAGGPSKKLEINETGVLNAVTNNTTIPGTFGGSGLRFTKLNSATPPATSNGKVLTVNANGDVILVTDQTGTTTATGGTVVAQNGLSIVGTNTVELGGTLLHNTNIDLANYNLSYYTGTAQRYERMPNGSVQQRAIGPVISGQGSFNDEVIATNTSNWNYGRVLSVSPQTSAVSPAGAGLEGYRLYVYGAPASSASGITGDLYGFHAITNNSLSTGNNFAVRAEANSWSGSSNLNIGVYGTGNFGQYNYGSYFLGINGTVASYGVYTEAQGTGLNYGIYAKAPPTPLTTTITNNYAGYFSGAVIKTGPDNFSSDLNLKQNFDTIANAISIINQLKPKTFKYKQSSFPSMSLPSGKQFGLVAQETEMILPELVNTVTHPAQLDSAGNIVYPSFNYKTLEYQQLIPILIKGMQIQQNQLQKQDSLIKLMQSHITALTSSVASCCSNSSIRTTNPSELNQLNINLSDKDIIVLNQNGPNPFAEQTTITYNVPEKYGYAQLIFSTIDGKIIKAVDITKKGRGQLNVFAGDLSSGMYTYSLIIDGKVMDTKKMLKSE